MYIYVCAYIYILDIYIYTHIHACMCTCLAMVMISPPLRLRSCSPWSASCGKIYSLTYVDRIWLRVHFSKIPIYTIFYLLKGDYNIRLTEC